MRISLNKPSQLRKKEKDYLYSGFIWCLFLSQVFMKSVCEAAYTLLKGKEKVNKNGSVRKLKKNKNKNSHTCTLIPEGKLIVLYLNINASFSIKLYFFSQ